MNNTAAHQDATVTPLLSKDLADATGKELVMIRVEYARAADPVHAHHAQASSMSSRARSRCR
jgi:hypothetical protein